MNTPNLQTFKQLAKKGNLIALTEQIPADLETPVSAFIKLAESEKHAFLLESGEKSDSIGRYSIIGFAPDFILKEEKGNCIQVKAGRKKIVAKGSETLSFINKFMKNHQLVNQEDLPDFCGGFVGYFGYENVRFFEKVQLNPKKGPDTPEFIFFFVKNYLVFDHYRKSLTFVSICDLKEEKSITKAYENAQKDIQKYSSRLKKSLKPLYKKSGSKQTPKLNSNTTRGQFVKRVSKIKQYIKAGDCIQVVLSQRFQAPFKGNDLSIYRALRSINPSPYMFYFRSGDTSLIGASPELLVRNLGRRAEVRPIAGTRPRGNDEREDKNHRNNLLRSKKELAEHLMLVDLGRNDLGRVCEFESVTVDAFARVENYSHVMHLVSDVSGKLSAGQNRKKLLEATFPAGTVTGAPKIRAMEIIDELETEKRGPYAGALGYFSFNGNMETCITIRTVVKQGKKIYVQAGAGIVKDSNPQKEYEETVNKAKAMFQAIQDQEKFNATCH